jgi:hypothetical protein
MQHVFQPYDVGVYGSLKQVWKEILNLNTGSKYRKKTSRLIGHQFQTTISTRWISWGGPLPIGQFRATGLYPFCGFVRQASTHLFLLPSHHGELHLHYHWLITQQQHCRNTTADQTPKMFRACTPTSSHWIDRTTKKKDRPHSLHTYGEALISDETLECLIKAEEEKEVQ